MNLIACSSRHLLISPKLIQLENDKVYYFNVWITFQYLGADILYRSQDQRNQSRSRLWSWSIYLMAEEQTCWGNRASPWRQCCSCSRVRTWGLGRAPGSRRAWRPWGGPDRAARCSCCQCRIFRPCHTSCPKTGGGHREEGPSWQPEGSRSTFSADDGRRSGRWALPGWWLPPWGSRWSLPCRSGPLV